MSHRDGIPWGTEKVESTKARLKSQAKQLVLLCVSVPLW